MPTLTQPLVMQRYCEYHTSEWQHIEDAIRSHQRLVRQRQNQQTSIKRNRYGHRSLQLPQSLFDPRKVDFSDLIASNGIRISLRPLNYAKT